MKDSNGTVLDSDKFLSIINGSLLVDKSKRRSLAYSVLNTYERILYGCRERITRRNDTDSAIISYANDRATPISYMVFDLFFASHIISRMKREYPIKDFFVLYILTEDKIIEKSDLNFLNFNERDIGKKASSVLSLRYNVPLLVLKGGIPESKTVDISDFINLIDFDIGSITNSISLNLNSESFINPSFKNTRIKIIAAYDYGTLNKRSLVQKETILMFSKKGVSLRSHIGNFFDNSVNFSRNEILNLLWVNLSAIFSSEKYHELNEIDLIDMLSLHKKNTDGTFEMFEPYSFVYDLILLTEERFNSDPINSFYSIEGNTTPNELGENIIKINRALSPYSLSLF